VSYLNNFVTRELQEGNIGSVTGHEVTIQDSQDTFMGDDEKVVLLSLQFQDNWLEAHSEVVIGL
jgi:hypothetical protein